MRLIDADELKKALGITSEDCNKCGWGSYESCGRGYDFEDACVAIDNAVTINAVPVVRCKDCLHNRACEIQYHAQAGDLFFCGAAERKDGDNGKAD
jgi:hypothetical protein